MSELYRWVDAEDADRGTSGRIRKIRQALDTEAIGINQFHLEPGQEGHRHDELKTGDEEVYLVLAGSGVMRVAGDEVELRPGRYLLVAPEATRQPVAGPDGLVFVCVGAPHGGREQRRDSL